MRKLQNSLGTLATAQAEMVEQSRLPGRQEWINTWGAIATSPGGNGGVSSQQLSEEAARDKALENCRTQARESDTGRWRGIHNSPND